MGQVWSFDATSNADQIRATACQEVAEALRRQGPQFFTLQHFIRICDRYNPAFALGFMGTVLLYHEVLERWCGPPYKPASPWSMMLLGNWAARQHIEGVFGFSHVQGVQFSDPSALTLFVLHD